MISNWKEVSIVECFANGFLLFLLLVPNTSINVNCAKITNKHHSSNRWRFITDNVQNVFNQLF